MPDERLRAIEITVIPPIIERLRKFAEFRPQRLDFELLELMRDAENAIVTEQEMHAAWRKRAEEAEQREDSALMEAAGLVCAFCRDKEIHGLPVTKLERNKKIIYFTKVPYEG